MAYLEHPILRPKSLGPRYPPYHQGEFLEEYFFKYWRLIRDRFKQKYIDVFWTNIFSNTESVGEVYPDIQRILDHELDPNGTYFTICQFDDGPLERLPQLTTIFSSGCNRRHGNVVPIPLICSPIPKNSTPNNDKTQFASFIGSLTHPIRDELITIFAGNKKYRFSCGSWTSRVSDKSLQLFLDVTASSRFTLCPRGYGRASFRLYEAMQLGSVPVYISDHHVLPWAEELDWEEFCVIVDAAKVPDIDRILTRITDKKYERMRKRAKEIYPAYFSLEGVAANILRRID
jgi:hypothetical protein